MTCRLPSPRWPKQMMRTPGYLASSAALAVATGALVAGLRGAGAVAGLVMLPLAVPLLIFGAGAIDGGAGGLKLLARPSAFIGFILLWLGLALLAWRLAGLPE